MIIEQLEDLQVISMDNLPKYFEKGEVLEEDLMSRLGVENNKVTGFLISNFLPNSNTNRPLNNDKVLKELNTLLKWISICMFTLGIPCPDTEEVISDIEWPDEIFQCGVLASLALQHKLTSVILDYFLKSPLNIEKAREDIFDSIVLINIISQKVEATFEEVLSFN